MKIAQLRPRVENALRFGFRVRSKYEVNCCWRTSKSLYPQSTFASVLFWATTASGLSGLLGAILGLSLKVSYEALVDIRP